MTEFADGDGQLHTLGLLERLRAECKTLWGTSSELYFRVDELLRELANPNLHDIPTNLPFRVEMWDRHDQHIRWVISASSSVSMLEKMERFRSVFEPRIAALPAAETVDEDEED